MDIFADRCALLWDKPTSDGGSPVTHYVVERLDQDGDGEWQKVCETKDTEVDVTDLTPGHKYQFRVSAFNAEGQSPFLGSDGAILAKDPWGWCCLFAIFVRLSGGLSLLLYVDFVHSKASYFDCSFVFALFISLAKPALTGCIFLQCYG